MPDRGLILSREILASKFGTSIDYDKFNQMLDGRLGYDLIWSRAMRCPCFSSVQSDQADASCTSCHGSGSLYVHPYPENYPEGCDVNGHVSSSQGMAIRAIIESIPMQGDFFSKPGDYVTGKVMVTVKGAVRIGYFDRFLMVDAEGQFDQVLVRDAVATVPIGKSATTQLRYPIVKVEDVHTLTARYRFRTDFTISPAGELVWVTGRGPAVGVRYAIRYSYHPVLIVIDYPRAISGARRWGKHTQSPVDSYESLPISALAALDFLT